MPMCPHARPNHLMCPWCMGINTPVVGGNGAAESEAVMERQYKVGQHVIYVDPNGVCREALVTIWWGATSTGYTSPTGEPGCNLVVVCKDPAKDDSYGRQTEHATSVVHKSKQAAHGNYWRWPDEDGGLPLELTEA